MKKTTDNVAPPTEELEALKRRTEAELLDAEENFRLIFETMPIGWAEHEMIFDGEGRPEDYVFLKVNAAFERFTGLERCAILGKRVTEVIPGIRTAEPDLITLYGEVTLTGEERRLEIYFAPFDRWYAVKAFRRREGHFVAMFEDISERKRADETLKKLNENLARSNRELEQFAYVASHDLQEPLRMVASYTQLLAQRYEGKLDEKADRYIAHAVDGARRMQQLISDLLTYSRVESEGRPPESTDCSEVVTEVLRSLEKVIDECDAEIVFEDLPTVLADRSQLGQVFQNLLSNALKFRGEARPRVEIAATYEGKEWQLSVIDNGIGVAPKYHERIFTIFQRLHERGRYPGSGIGLSIVKKIVERHGGRIRVDSAPGGGSHFIFTMPAVSGARRTQHE